MDLRILQGYIAFEELIAVKFHNYYETFNFIRLLLSLFYAYLPLLLVRRRARSHKTQDLTNYYNIIILY